MEFRLRPVGLMEIFFKTTIIRQFCFEKDSMKP